MPGRTQPHSRSADALLDELRALISRHATPDSTTPIRGMRLSRTDGAQEPGTSPSGTVFALIAQGGKRLALGDRIAEYRAGQYLVASVDVPVTGHYVGASPAEPALGFGLVLQPEAIASLLLEAGPAAVPGRATDPTPALAVTDAPIELLDAVVRMARLLDHEEDQAILAPMLEREILWRLLKGPIGPTVAQIGMADSCTTQISRAVRWITEHYDESFRVDELASSCGLSASAFHRKFQQVTALSPIQFQKHLRLHQARLLLLSGDLDVATAAHRVGYDSATQFNREYRRQFGAPPGRHAAQLRDPGRQGGPASATAPTSAARV